ncbi:MAG TPA: M28 family peptidase [Cyclobacteriaceae bacterium]|nr:M28 family peptidase [Cyclobacteriaceae bacterium]
MRILLFCLPFALGAALSVPETADVENYAARITPERLREFVSVLAHDSLEGRETGKRGQRKAAEYIRAHFQKIGLKGPADKGHFQTLELYRAEPGEIYVKSGDKTFSHTGKVVYLGRADSDGEVTLPLVYAGYGREEDFSTIDVTGKAVLIRIRDGRLYNLPEISRARQHGAKMVFIWSFDGERAFDDLAFRERASAHSDRPSLEKPHIHAPNAGSFVVAPSVVSTLMGVAPDKLKAVASEDPAKKPLTRIRPTTVTYRTEMKVVTIPTENVLGLLEGTDLADEVVVITAHYDHIGISKGVRGDSINNGADDDASGTAAVMQLAQAFADAKRDGRGPRRSILFMAFTGEEKGLLGSAYYSANPVFPMEKTVLNLNMDMIGRRDADHKDSPPYVYIIGTGDKESELNRFSETINNKYCDLIFDYTYNDRDHPTRLFYRSDHWNFAKHGVPIIFYFDGLHEDYHKPSDEVDKIEFDLLTKRAQCVFYTAWEAANRDKRLPVP